MKQKEEKKNETMKSKFLVLVRCTRSVLQETRSTFLFITVYSVTIEVKQRVALEVGRMPVTYTEVKTLPLRYSIADKEMLLGIGEERIFLPIKMEKNLIFFRLMKNKT